MNPDDYAFACDLLRAETGVVLGAGKQYLVESRLSPLLRSGDYEDLADVFRAARAGSPSVRTTIVDALTTHETYFFRDVHPFETLRSEILPALIASSGGRRLTMWSAAAATGQEPYSLALLMLENFPDQPVSIVATDVSTECITLGRRGLFTQLDVNRGLPSPLLVKYFAREGLSWRIDARARQLVTFRQANLIRPWPALPGMDVILLRNVLTYFDRGSRQEVLRRAAATLRPGGVLLLGGSETTIGIDHGLRWSRIGKTVLYRKEGAGHD